MTRRKLMIAALAGAATALVGFQAAKKVDPVPSDPLLAGFYRSTVASVADAVDQVVGQRGFMSHKVRPVVSGRVVGRAVTALVAPAPAEKATPQLAVLHSREMIDNAKPGEVGIIVIQDGADVAAIGGLMGTAAKARGMAGIIIDGGVRDVAELRALALPTYASSITPATAVGRYASVSRNEPVKCGDVLVRPGDIIVAGEDGVVVVPQEKAQEVLKRAQEIDKTETAMVPVIKQFRSLGEAIKKFNRI
jgi:regulator of RNase E activity RraA